MLNREHPFFRYPAHSLYKVNFSRYCRLMQIFWLFISLYSIISLVKQLLISMFEVTNKSINNGPV